MTQMLAAVRDVYGSPDVIRIEQLDRPTPAADEVLVLVHATTVNRTDTSFLRGKPAIVRPFSGMRRPRRRILGTEFAGMVAGIGVDVTDFAVGDRVFGVNADRFGAHAEYLVVKQTGPIATLPDAVGFNEAAAACDGFVLASTCLQWADVRADQRVMVYGASGAIGTAGVQIAKHSGATVTAVCNTDNVEVVTSLGPDQVIDYTAQDFAAGPAAYDVVFDAVGKLTFGQCRGLLRRGGVFVTTDLGPMGQSPLLAMATWLPSKLGAKQAMMPLPVYRKADVETVKNLMEQGRFQPVIDRTYTLDRITDAAHYVETEQKTGNVVIEIVDPVL